MAVWDITDIGHDPENSRMENDQGRITVLKSVGGKRTQTVNYGRARFFRFVYSNITAAQAAQLDGEAEANVGGDWTINWHDGNSYECLMDQDALFQPNPLGGRFWNGTVGFATKDPGS